MSKGLQAIHFRVPVWVTAIYCLLSLILVPWTFYLSVTLPQHHLSSHWALSWVGLDFGLVAMLLITGLLAYYKSDWVVISATATGSFLIADAWFDIMSAHAGTDLDEAVLMAVLVEIPLAIISYILAHRIVMKNLRMADKLSTLDNETRPELDASVVPAKSPAN